MEETVKTLQTVKNRKRLLVQHGLDLLVTWMQLNNMHFYTVRFKSQLLKQALYPLTGEQDLE